MSPSRSVFPCPASDGDSGSEKNIRTIWNQENGADKWQSIWAQCPGALRGRGDGRDLGSLLACPIQAAAAAQALPIVILSSWG